MILFVSMFVSSTYAWFADFVYNANNQTTAGSSSVFFASATHFTSGNISGTTSNLITTGKDQSLFVFENQEVVPLQKKSFYLRVRTESNIPISYEIAVLNLSNIENLENFSLKFERVTSSSNIIYNDSADIGEIKLFHPSNFNEGLLVGFEIFHMTLTYIGEEPLVLVNEQKIHFNVFLNSWYTQNPTSKAILIYKASQLETFEENFQPNLFFIHDIDASHLDLMFTQPKNLRAMGHYIRLKSFTMYVPNFHTLDFENATLIVESFMLNGYMIQANHRSNFSIFSDDFSLSLTQGTYRQHGLLTVSHQLIIDEETRLEVFPSASLFVYGTWENPSSRLVFLSVISDPKLFIHNITEHRHSIFINHPLQLHYLSRSVLFGHSFQSINIEILNHLEMSVMPWTPLGTAAFPFKGTIIGNNFSLQNLRIEGIQPSYGFLGHHQGVVQNLLLSNMNLIPSALPQGSANISPLVNNLSGSMTNVTLTGTVVYQDPMIINYRFNGWFGNSSFEGERFINESIDQNFVNKTVYLSTTPL